MLKRLIAAGLGVIAACLALPSTGSAAATVFDFEGLKGGEAIGQF